MKHNTIIHTKRLNEETIRELSVYYEKGGMSHWTGRAKPKGIYFSTTLAGHVAGSGVKTWSTGQKSDGYILVTALQNYKPTALKSAIKFVEDNADLLHAVLEADETDVLIRLLKGEYSEEGLRGLNIAFAPVPLGRQFLGLVSPANQRGILCPRGHTPDRNAA